MSRGDHIRSSRLGGEWRTEMKATERLDVLEGHMVARVPGEDDGGQGNAIVDTGAGDSEV